MLEKIKAQGSELWQQPKVRYGVIGALLLGAMTFIAFNTDDMDTGGTSTENGGTVAIKKETKKRVEANFFTQAGADEIDQGRMDEIYGLMEEQLAEREQTIDEREEEMKMMEGRVMQELENLRFTQNDLKRQIEIQQNANTELMKKAAQPPAASSGNSFTPPIVAQPATQQPSGNGPMTYAVQQVMPKVIDHSRIGVRKLSGGKDLFIDGTGEVKELNRDPNAPPPAEEQQAQGHLEQSKEEDKEREMFLPAGSILSGVLITGMDVPTGSSTLRDPFPAILRIKEEALLPNNFTADVRECVIVASAVGDLASRRAYLRAEAISCVTDAGNAVEANLNAFAVGGDGRNGIQGRLVSKNGEAAMKSAFAGFLSGIANLAGTSTYNIADDETGVFGALQDPKVMQSLAGTAALQGASSAMDRLAEYYIEIAEQMKPYIEINPGLQIDFIIQRGSSLRLD